MTIHPAARAALPLLLAAHTALAARTGTAGTAAPFAGRIDTENAGRLLVGGPDAVGGIDDWALSNGLLCAVIADPGHEGYLLPTGGSLVDLGHCGREDDQFVILEGLANLSRSDPPAWQGVEVASDAEHARLVVRGERAGIAITTTYALDVAAPDTLQLETRLERRSDGPRLFAFGDASIHYAGTLRPWVLARTGASEGFEHQATGSAGPRDLVTAIVPVETIALIGSPLAGPPISYALRITDARFEGPGAEPRRVATFGLSTDTVTFLGVLARPVWVGSDEHAGLLQLAQSLFMDLEIGEAIVFERQIRVAPRSDAVAFTDALREGAAWLRGTTSPAARIHVAEPDGSAVGFAAPDPNGHFALRVPAGSHRLRVLGPAGASTLRDFEIGGEDIDLGHLELPARARVDLPADLAPARLVFRGIGDTPDPVFWDDLTAMRAGGVPKPAHTATPYVFLAGLDDDPDHVVLAPGRYRVHATRGPEFDVSSTSIEVGPGEHIALELAAPLRVLETPGWIAADLHVHAAPSDDSTVPMRIRLASFVAEGGEVLVSTDHDHVSDYAPLIDALGLGSRVRSIVGLEITSTVATPAAPFTAGHSNVFPLPYRPLAHRKGALRSEGRRLRDMIAQARAMPGERLFQLNHAREPESDAISQEGAFFTHLSVGRRFDPALPLDDPNHRSLVERDPRTGLRDLDFDAMELLNGPSMSRYRNLRADWFALLRQGERPTATGNSDTHTLRRVPAIPRNYVRMTDDAPEAFDEAEFIQHLKAGESFVTTGPMLEARLDGAGKLEVSVRAAPWVPLSRLRVFVNGLLAHDGPAPADGTASVPLGLERDAFVTVEVEGEPTGLWSDLLPEYAPFAHTNPIFVDADEDGVWQPPGL